MKKFSLIALTLLAYAAQCLAAPPPPAPFSIKKVEAEYVDSPEMAMGGARLAPAPLNRLKWLKIEVTFDTVIPFTEELTFNYYVYFEGRLLAGKVDHINIIKGTDLHSVMFMEPRTVYRLLKGKEPNPQISNIAVTVTKPGSPAPIAIAQGGRLVASARGEWWAAMKKEEGFLLTKSETPFAMLAWDSYEPVKPAAPR